MAVDVAEELQGAGTQVDLRARLAELPTITSVGMNALAPVAMNGRLALAGKAGFVGLQAAGVKQFVFTADHGFLLQDATTSLHPYAFGKKTDPCRRHVLDEISRPEAGLVTASLAALGYVSAGGEPAPGYLVFCEDTAV